MARPPKAPPPCHCAYEGTVAKPGSGPNREDRTPAAIHCPRHKRWVPYADPVVTCGDPLYRCRCTKPAGHAPDDPIHECGPEVCGGSWSWLDGHRFVAHTYPRPVYEGAVLPPPPDVRGRDGVLFVECGADGSPVGVTLAPRGGIRFLPSPDVRELAAPAEPE